MARIILGIDPGKNGGIAAIATDTRQLLEVVKMPPTPADILNYLRHVSDTTQCVAYLEKVGGMPGQGGAASFTFGENYGQLTLALLACGIPTEIVSPAKWQKSFNLQGKKGESKTDHKNRMKARAQQLFPTERVTLWSADALLIAKYGEQQERV